MSEALQASLLRMIGKPIKEFVHVDFGAKLTEKGLADLFPEEVG